MKKNLISIGIPVYNGINFISDAIDSVLQQDYRYFEIIISDNLSNDRTLEFIKKKYGNNKKIKIFEQKKHLKAFQNFLFTYKKSSGQIFKWLAHDDYLKNKDILKAVNTKFNNGFKFVFTNNEVKDLTQNTHIKNYMKNFSKITSQNNFLLESIFSVGFLFYGFYLRDSVKEFINELANDHKHEDYITGLFVHKNLIKAKTYYLSKKNIVFRVTSHSGNKNMNPISELRGYFNYYKKTLKAVIKSGNLDLFTKIKFFLFFSKVCSKYSIVILRKLLKYSIRNLFEVLARY